MADFMRDVAYQAGQQVIYQGQEQQRQAVVANEQALGEARQLQNNAEKRRVQSEQDLGKFITAEMQASQTKMDTPDGVAAVFTKAAAHQMSQGNYTQGLDLSKAAAAQHEQGVKVKLEVARDKVAKQEEFAKAALAYQNLNTASQPTGALHTPEQTAAAEEVKRSAQTELVQAALAAGINPKDIPLPGSPLYPAFVQNAAEGAQSSEKLLAAHQAQRALVAKTTLEAEKLAMQQTNQQLTRSDKAAARQDKAAYQAAKDAVPKIGRQPAIIDVGGYKWSYRPGTDGTRLETDPNYVMLGENTTATERGRIQSVYTAAAETNVHLENLMKLSGGAEAGVFHAIGQGDIPKALQSAAGRGMTPTENRIYETTMGGVGLLAAQMSTAFSARGANQSIINEFQRVLTSEPGDTVLSKMYKLATVAQLERVILQATPKNLLPEKEAVRTKLLRNLDHIPEPSQVIMAMRARGEELTAKQDKTRMSLGSLMKQAKDLAEMLDGAVVHGDTVGSSEKASASPTPSRPPEINDLLNKYK